jgi:hypothetical protein
VGKAADEQQIDDSERGKLPSGSVLSEREEMVARRKVDEGWRLVAGSSSSRDRWKSLGQRLDRAHFRLFCNLGKASVVTGRDWSVNSLSERELPPNQIQSSSGKPRKQSSARTSCCSPNGKFGYIRSTTVKIGKP